MGNNSPDNQMGGQLADAEVTSRISSKAHILIPRVSPSYRATPEAQKVGPPHGVRGTGRNSCAAIGNIVCCLWQPTYLITH